VRINPKIAAILLFSAVAVAAAPDRITGPIDPSGTTVLRGQVHRLAQPQFDQGPADPGLEIPYVTVFLQPSPGLEQFLATQHGKWLTPEGLLPPPA
jgi:hypothetical protein